MTPSRRLTEILSTYLEFDSKQLQLGLWSGDLQIRNVNLKKDSIDPLLNTWKDESCNMDIASLMTKEALVDSTPSFSSLLDLKLISGNIGYVRAQVPWKSLLLGAGDNTVHIELHDVTIRLGFESTLAKELQRKHGVFSKVYCQNRQSMKLKRLSRHERLWKQEMIRIAEQCHRDGKNIPSPAEFAELKKKYQFPKDEAGVDGPEGYDEEHQNPHPSILERFVKSFATSIGWRVGEGLKLSIRNIQIFFVQDNISIGIHIDTIDIRDYSHGEDESMTLTDDGSDMSLIKHDSSKKTQNVLPDENGIFIKKQMKVTNCGVFVKDSTPVSLHHGLDPAMDEFIILPTNISVTMCLRKSGNNLEVKGTVIHHEMSCGDEMNDQDSCVTVAHKKIRRGKREKEQHLMSDSLVNMDTEHKRNMGEGSISKEVEKDIASGEERESINTFAQRNFENIGDAELTALFSMKISLNRLVVVATTRSMTLIDRFLKHLSKIKHGRPHGTLVSVRESNFDRMRFCRQMLNYTFLSVLKDFRRRKLLIDYFAKQGEAYTQQPFRQQYIDIYSALEKNKIKINTEDIDSKNIVFNRHLQEDFLVKMEDGLSVEQILLYRKLSEKNVSTGKTNDLRKEFRRFSSTPDIGSSDDKTAHRLMRSYDASISPSRDAARRRHRASQSTGMPLLQRSNSNMSRILKHNRNQSLNVDNMNDFLDILPSSRQKRYSTDFTISTDAKFCDGANLREQVETMNQFDDVILKIGMKRGNAGISQPDGFFESDSIGSISSSFSLSFSEINVFVCMESDYDEDLDLSDELSLSTSKSDVLEDINHNGLVIFGCDHDILMSFNVTKLKLSSYKELHEDRQSHVFSIEAMFCRVGDAMVMKSGKFSQPTNKFRIQGPVPFSYPRTIGELCIYDIREDLTSTRPFLYGKIECNRRETSINTIQSSVSDIFLTFESRTLGKISDCINSFSSPQSYNFLSNPVYNEIRLTAATSLIRHVKKTSFDDLRLDFHGFYLDLRERNSDSNDNSFKLSILKVQVGSGDLLNDFEAKQLGGILTVCRQNTIITFNGLQMLVGKSNIFEQAIEGDIFFACNCVEEFYSEQPREIITVHISPINLCVTRHAISKISTLILLYENWNKDIVKSREVKARLAVLLHSKMKKIHFQVQSLRIALEHEDCAVSERQKATHLRGVALEETLEDLLSFLICFPYPFLCKSTKESIAITRGRLLAMGFSDDEARKCESFLLERFRHRFSLFEATKRSSKDTFTSSHHGYRKKNDMFREDKVIERLIASTVSDTIDYISGFELCSTLEWFNSLILDLPSGFTCDIDLLSYDWSLSWKTKEFVFRNGAGRKFVSVSHGNTEVGTQYSEGLLFNFSRQISDLELGTNGIGFIDLSDDDYIQRYLLAREPHLELLTSIHSSIGVFDIHFSDFHYSSALDQWTSMVNALNLNADNSLHNIRTCEGKKCGFSLSFDIGEFNLLLCTDDFYPFTKILLTDLSADLSSSSLLMSEMTMMQAVARCNNIYLYDLSPEGQLYDNIIESKEESSLEIRMSVSNNNVHHPSEILVVIRGITLFFVRRYINESIQYLFSSQYGIGHFISVNFTDLDAAEDSKAHPVCYQICFLDVSIICPTTSKSADLIGLKTKRLVLMNNYENETSMDSNWVPDRKCATGYQNDDEKDPASVGYEFQQHDLRTDSIVFDDSRDDASQLFDTSLFLRISLEVEQLRLFTGLSDLKHHDGCSDHDFFYLSQFLTHGTIERESPIFYSSSDLPESFFSKRKLFDRLCSRRWREVTMSPLQLTVLIDILPSCLRILIRDDDDGSEVSPVGVKLTLSQFCAFLSMWYGNMQELPMLFPFSLGSVMETIEIPECPSDWPEYGTDGYVNRISENVNKNIQMLLSFSRLSWQCSFDVSEYFSRDVGCRFMLNSESDGICFEADVFLLQVEFRIDNVMKVGCTSQGFSVRDLRWDSDFFQDCFRVTSSKRSDSMTMPDMNWGLNFTIPNEPSKVPLQFTVFMSPDRNCMVNIGICHLDSCSTDLGFFWILLEYFSCYFLYPEFGNPYFAAETMRIDYLERSKKLEPSRNRLNCLNLDVRLWLDQPSIAIPSDSNDPNAPVLLLKSQNGGIFYRYRTIDYNFSSQIIVTKNLDILFLRKMALNHTTTRKLNSTERDAHFVAAALSISFNYEIFVESKHFNLSISSLSPDQMNGKVDFFIVEPLVLPSCTVCNPAFRFHMQPRLSPICEIFVTPEYLKDAGDLLSKFVGPYQQIDDCEPQNSKSSFTINVYFDRLRFVVCEPILGMHLPLANLYISELKCSVSRLQSDQDLGRDEFDFQVSTDVQIWIDYYKSGPTRSWEPLFEPFKCTVLFEKSFRRGQGLTFLLDCPLHINISGAFLETLCFATDSLYKSVFKALRDGKNVAKTLTMKQVLSPSRALRPTCTVSDIISTADRHVVEVHHEKVQTISSKDHVAFSLMNLSGNRLRFHQHTKKKDYLSVRYLDHLGITTLSFPPTRSVIRNLNVVEIPSDCAEDDNFLKKNIIDSSHFVDIQIPGMDWFHAICIDKIGKRFVNLKPRSNLVKQKLIRDWRLANVFCLLTEVSSLRGGRQLTVTSPISIMNKTNHEIRIAFHADPKHLDKIQSESVDLFARLEDGNSQQMEFDIQHLRPNEIHHVPITLMEAALHFDGSNLGSFWIKPERKEIQSVVSSQGHSSTQNTDGVIGYCSRAVDISKLVHETADMFRKDDPALDDINTDYNIFCPVINMADESVSPFCYCIEVRRSPIVHPFPGHQCYDVTTNSDRNENIEEKSGHNYFDQSSFSSMKNMQLQNHGDFDDKDDYREPNMHGPVSYSLIIYPPFMITNMIPEPARYELMHAVRKQIVWWRDIEPGESVPIHSVGLDSPLLLLINVGYCRTPIGEGALIHQGTESNREMKEYQEIELKESQTMENSYPKNRYSSITENTKFGTEEIASSMVVVDSIGQSLVLNIDNELGAGGQRHITISCPYWIVNTTEHPLRYKQENSSNLVCGSTPSALRDGSKPVDSSKRNSFSDRTFQNTIFPGKPGALYGAKNRLNLHDYTELLCSEVSIDKLAKIAFMFNYRESHPFGGFNRLSLQLVDPAWRSYRFSEWSRGFSLESIGVTQIVGMHCLDGRQLEVAVIITVAPGELSKYTKIVRICPRYVLINQLSRPIRLWQDSSLVHPSKVLDATKDAPAGMNEHSNWKICYSEQCSADEENDLLSQYNFLFGDPTVLDYGQKMPCSTVAHKSALYITTAGTNEPIPFHLPDTRADRELRIDLGPNWNLSASFPADIISDYTLNITRVVDLRVLKHVDNRGSSKYKVELPPGDILGLDMDLWDGELGIWFENIQWNGGMKCIVKGTKRGKFSYYNTDIHVGDELLSIDGVPIGSMEFSDTMKLLKDRLAQVASTAKKKKIKGPKFFKRFERTSFNETSVESSHNSSKEDSTKILTLEFQTLEYRMKKLRDRALLHRKGRRKKKNLALNSDDTTVENMKNQRPDEKDCRERDTKAKEYQIHVNLKLLNQSLFVFVNESNGTSPYRVENRSLNHFIYFRQRACDSHRWHALAPCKSMNYAWDEPLKPNKLLIKIGVQHASMNKESSDTKLSFSMIESEDQGGFGPTKTVKLDEVGFECAVPCPEKGPSKEISFLHCTVDTDGATRVLIISDTKSSETADELRLLTKHIDLLSKELESERMLLCKYQEKKKIFGSELTDKNFAGFRPKLLPTVQEDTDTSASYRYFVDNEPEVLDTKGEYDETRISRRNQLIVEVIEACGLQTSNHSALNGLCNPYCTVKLEERSTNLQTNLFSHKLKSRKTYFIERCSNPKWSGMKFVFDVPPSAVNDPHGYAVIVKVKDHRYIGRNRHLGRTEIHLRNLRNQKEVSGWFPLLFKSGRGTDLTNPATAGRVRGSIKLRAQWIYETSALIDYFILLSESRLTELLANRESTKLNYEKLLIEQKKKKELDLVSFSYIPLLHSDVTTLRKSSPHMKSTDGVRSSAKKNMKGTKLRSLWRRQQQNNEMLSPSIPLHENHTVDISVASDHQRMEDIHDSDSKSFTNKRIYSQGESNMFPMNRSVALSEGNVLKPFSQSVNTTSEQDFDVIEDHDLKRIHDFLTYSHILKNRHETLFHHHHLEKAVLLFDDFHNNQSYPARLDSWIVAYDVLNDPDIKWLFVPRSETTSKIDTLHKKKINTLNKLYYPQMALSTRAPLPFREINMEFQRQLLNSRASFEKAAQRSIMAVINPGGWLVLRPITALCLPENRENKYTGMFVRVRYGSKSCNTAKTDAKVTPIWADESSLFSNVAESGEEKLKPNFFEIQENDIKVAVEPLKTTGSIKLSVLATKMSSKIELGVLQIPLAQAISCCTEASGNKPKYKMEGSEDYDIYGVYIRWFPLKDPNDCVTADGQVDYRPYETEQVCDDRFSRYMTPCIKIAMWWQPDNNNTVGKIHSTEQEETNLEGKEPKFKSLVEKYCHARLDALSVSLIDSARARELVSVTTSDIDLRYSHTKSTTQVGIAVGRIQADQQVEKPFEPVILCPHPVPNPQPTIQFLAIKNNIRSKSNLDSFKHIAVALEEMDLRIEERCMLDIWELFYGILRQYDASKDALTFAPSGDDQIFDEFSENYFEDCPQPSRMNEVMDFMSTSSIESSGRRGNKAKLIYIEKLMLGPVKVNVSYVKSVRNEKLFQNEMLTISHGKFVPQVTLNGSKRNIDVTEKSPVQRRTEIFQRWSEFGDIEDWSTDTDTRTRNFHNVITAAFPAITDAPIRINGKAIDNIFEYWSEIFANLKHFYVKEMVFQVHKVIGSVDFFGNPTMAVNSIMKGAHDFVMLPFREFLRSPNNPSKLGIGVAKGTLSLLSHFFSGIFGFVSNISEAGGTAAAALSFDEHFKRWHKQQVADHFLHMHGQFRPQGCELVVSTLTRPLQDIVAGLLFAASGVLVEPYKGAQLKGITGFSKGIGIGTIGLIAKPLVGVFDAFAHLSESFHDVARSANVLDKKSSSIRKIRLPHVFGLQKLLLPYNPVDGYCANLLRLFPLRDDKRSQAEDIEVLIISQRLLKEPGVGWYIVVTTKRVLKVTVRHDFSTPPTLEWQVTMGYGVDITSTVEHATHNKVLLQIISKRKHSDLQRGKKQSTNYSKHHHSPTYDPHSDIDIEDCHSQPTGYQQKTPMRQNPVQNALGAFGTYKTKKKEITIHTIPGDFQTERDALIQIHNAICCVTKHFDSTISRNYGSVVGALHSEREGHTSFGPFHFGEEFEKMSEVASGSLNNIEEIENLDQIPWAYFDYSKHTKRRFDWTYKDELEASRSIYDGPEWIIEAIARSTFVQVTRPLSFDATASIDIDIEKSKDETDEKQQIHAVSLTSENLGGRRATHDFNDELNRLEMLFDRKEGSSGTNANKLSVEARLENIESILRRLLTGQSSVQLNVGETSNKQPNVATALASNNSAISVLTGSGDIIPENNLGFNPPLNETLNETDILKLEIQRLQQQLAQKDSDTESKSRKKRKFKKFWKT